MTDQRQPGPRCFHCGREKDAHVANDPHCGGYEPDRGEDTNAEMIRRLRGSR